MSKLNTDGVLLFEQPFAKVPYENYRKVFKTQQRNIEKEMTALQTTAKDLTKRSREGNQNSAASIKAVEGMITRVENLKRKLSDLHENVGRPTQLAMRDRASHLKEFEALDGPSNSNQYSNWADTRLDRWLVDWSLRNNKQKTARLLAQEKGIETLVDIDLFTEISRIEDALRRHSCTEALGWCSENKAALRKSKDTLEFELRLQEFIELARARKTTEAITYSKKHLVSWHETHMDQIRRAMTLLAFPQDTACGPYKRLYSLSRWEDLVKAFRNSVFSLNTLPNQPILHLALYAGLASLKLPACYQHSSRNADCPTCDAQLGILAKEVPRSHQVNSTIVCSISGKVMDEDNPPMAFPNGNVYSKMALEELLSKHPDNLVQDPKTGETCAWSELRRLFIS